MLRGKLPVLAAILIVIGGSIVWGCSTAPAPEAAETVAEAGAPTGGEGVSLLQERCTRCHDLTRVEQAAKTRDAWQVTVERMVGKGADLDTDEQAVVVGHLAETYGP